MQCHFEKNVNLPTKSSWSVDLRNAQDTERSTKLREAWHTIPFTVRTIETGCRNSRNSEENKAITKNVKK